MDKQTDLYGKALLDYYQGNYTEDITVLSPTMEDDILPLPYLFRSFDNMPLLEQKALQLSYGKILDIGAGSGCHAVHLENKGLNITAIDQSPGAISVLKQRLKSPQSSVVQENIWDHTGTYNTLLLLMNGTGIFERLEQVATRLEYLKKLLEPNGQILIDSSDLKFLYEDDDDGGLWVDASKSYYGEVSFSLRYKGEVSAVFDWLYMDYNLLKSYAQKSGFQIDLVEQGTHYDYLARLFL